MFSRSDGVDVSNNVIYLHICCGIHLIKQMTRFKHIILAAIAAVVSVMPAGASSPYHGQKCMGIIAGYTTRNESATAGIIFTYRFSEHLRIAPSAGYDFRHQGKDAFSINLDFHMPLALNSAGTVNFYPLAGIGYTSFGNKYDAVNFEKSSDDRRRVDRIGFNLGGGIEYFASPTLRLAFEPKWRWRSDYASGVFNVSIGYVF